MNSEDDKNNSWAKQALEISTLYNISEIAQSVAYEINNPLMIINGYSKKIKKNADDPNYKDFNKDIEAIEKSSERINKIIQNLLQYSKQTLNLPLSNISFVEIVSNSIELYKETSNDVNTEIVFEKNIDSKINVNPTLCAQAIVNLLRNSIDHSSLNGSAKIELEFRNYKKRIELVIKDNGEKLSEDIQSKMFYQTFSTSSEGEAVGMGMNSSFNIAKKFDGDLYYDSSYTENAFILSFPEC